MFLQGGFMITIKHKFLGHQLNPKTETLIIGTFNPDTDRNSAEFFYGRSRNYFWSLLPIAFQSPDLKHASKSEKLDFMKSHSVDFIDLITKVDVEEGQEHNVDDIYIDGRVTEWADVIGTIQHLKYLKRVCLTRKTFTSIPNMRIKIAEVELYCVGNGISYEALNTPARYYSQAKQDQWTKFLCSNNQ